MDPLALELLKASPALALAVFVLLALRDQTALLRSMDRRLAMLALRDQTALLRSMDRRLAKVLENARALTPASGTPTRFDRARSRADSDDPPISIPRTNSEDDLGG